jgi:hypothetical protein
MLVDTMLVADTVLLRHRKTHRRYACAGIVVPANVERLASTICAIALLCPNKLTLSLPVVCDATCTNVSASRRCTTATTAQLQA